VAQQLSESNVRSRVAKAFADIPVAIISIRLELDVKKPVYGAQKTALLATGLHTWLEPM
jgi:hypothetical protein